MRCSICLQPLSPTEKDDILQALAEGIKPTVICDDCREEEEAIENGWSSDIDDEDDL